MSGFAIRCLAGSMEDHSYSYAGNGKRGGIIVAWWLSGGRSIRHSYAHWATPQPSLAVGRVRRRRCFDSNSTNGAVTAVEGLRWVLDFAKCIISRACEVPCGNCL